MNIIIILRLTWSCSHASHVVHFGILCALAQRWVKIYVYLYIDIIYVGNWQLSSTGCMQCASSNCANVFVGVNKYKFSFPFASDAVDQKGTADEDPAEKKRKKSEYSTKLFINLRFTQCRQMKDEKEIILYPKHGWGTLAKCILCVKSKHWDSDRKYVWWFFNLWYIIDISS